MPTTPMRLWPPHGPGPVWPWQPPASCFPENGVGLASLVDVYKWCVPGVHRGVPSWTPLGNASP